MSSSTSTRSPTSPPLTRADFPKFPVRTPANLGYGFIVDTACLHRWARVFYDRAHGPEVLASMSPEEVENALSNVEGMTSISIQHTVYRQFPRIPRLRHRLVLMRPSQGRWLLVLKDNSSQEVMDLKLAREDVAGVSELMGFGEQKPKWYILPSW